MARANLASAALRVACAVTLWVVVACDTHISLDGRDRRCALDGECVLAFEGDVCTDECNLNHAISIAAEDDFSRDVAAKEQGCLNLVIPRAGGATADCFNETVAACANGACIAAGPDGGPVDAGE